MTPGDSETATVPETADTAARTQASQHLREAVAATDPAEKRYHVREALQLLTIQD